MLENSARILLKYILQIPGSVNHSLCQKSNNVKNKSDFDMGVYLSSVV